MSEYDIKPQARGHDCLDDLGSLKGMSWRRFNNFTRVMRDGAIACGRPLPTRANVMEVILDRMNALSPEQISALVQECLRKREADDARRRGTRTRGLTQKETRRWSGR